MLIARREVHVILDKKMLFFAPPLMSTHDIMIVWVKYLDQ